MGDRLKIFNVNSYSSFSRSNSVIYCSYLSCPHFLIFLGILTFYFSFLFLSLNIIMVNAVVVQTLGFLVLFILFLFHHFLNLIHSYLWFFHFFHSYLILILSVPVVSWLNLFSNLFLNHKRITSWLIGNTINTLSSSSWLRLVFWKSIHLEVASGPFCLLVNSPWLLVFALCIFSLFFSGFNLYCWRGIHFSWSNSLIFLVIFSNLLFSFHFWFRDLLRELAKKYEILLMVLFLLFFLFLASEALLFVSFFWASFHSLSSPTLGIWPGEGFYLPDPCELTFANTLLLSNAVVSLGGAFVSLEISSQFLIFFSLFSFILAWTFISLQIKEFRIMGLSINDSVYSCLFFFLTGLHFFHLLFGLLLLCLFFWGCSFPFKIYKFINLRVSEVHLFYNLQLFYWHFLEILWLFIFLVFYL